MKKIFMVSCFVMFFLWGCSGNSFLGGEVSSSSGGGGDGGYNEGPEVIQIQLKAGSKASKDGVAELKFKAYGSTKDVQTTQKEPVAIMFLLDVTGSMSSYINVVKENVIAFAGKLKTLGFNNLKIGFISFRDSIVQIYNFTDNISGFQSAVSGQRADAGGDSPEAGLLAIQKAADIFSGDSSLSSYLKIMVFISDTLQHFQNNITPRDCSINSTVNKLNSLSPIMRKKTKLFFSVPDTKVVTCSDYSIPKFQLEELLSRVFTTVELSKRGGYLGWEFNQDSLMNKLPTELVNISESQVPCLIDKVEFNLDGHSIDCPTSYKRQYQLYLSGNETQAIIKDEDIVQAVKDGKITGGTVNVTQSCFSTSSAENFQFSSPIKTQTVSIPYTIEYKAN